MAKTLGTEVAGIRCTDCAKPVVQIRAPFGGFSNVLYAFGAKCSGTNFQKSMCTKVVKIVCTKVVKTVCTKVAKPVVRKCQSPLHKSAEAD